MAKKYQQFFQILVIPDDQHEPKTYSIPHNRIIFYKILAAVIIIHIVIGLVSYFQLFHMSKKNRKLVATNEQLRENNRRVDELEAVFNELVASQLKVKAALGLVNVDQYTPTIEIDDKSPAMVPRTVFASDAIVQNSQRADSVKMATLGFLTQSKSDLHDFVKSVPTLLPVEKGILSTDFDDEVFSGKVQHRGIDIAAEQGTLVRAAAEGIVVFSGYTYDLGNLIIIYHGSGFFTYYGHNQRLLLTRNSFVKKGEAIALVGNSGISSAPHLHFEIWKDGQPLNPKEYILAFNELEIN